MPWRMIESPECACKASAPVTHLLLLFLPVILTVKIRNGCSDINASRCRAGQQGLKVTCKGAAWHTLHISKQPSVEPTCLLSDNYSSDSYLSNSKSAKA